MPRTMWMLMKHLGARPAWSHPRTKERGNTLAREEHLKSYKAGSASPWKPPLLELSSVKCLLLLFMSMISDVAWISWVAPYEQSAVLTVKYEEERQPWTLAVLKRWPFITQMNMFVRCLKSPVKEKYRGPGGLERDLNFDLRRKERLWESATN